jgi:hypothetical protein
MHKPTWHFSTGIALVLVALILFGCRGESTITTAPPGVDAPPTEDQVAFKGFELYSWQDETGEWQYSILVGTNRIKSIQEVQENPMNLDQVKVRVSNMAGGESLFWFNRAEVSSVNGYFELAFPPTEVVEELKAYAAENQVSLFTPGK